MPRADFNGHRLPLIFNQFVAFFWLSSLVRYVPRMYADLERTRYWALINAICTESRITLAEQFNQHFFRSERYFVPSR